MKYIFLLGFLIISFNCELTRHSDDVLKRERIFIEGHRGVSNGQKNHNTKEAILYAMENKVEAFETDVWLSSDKKVFLFHNEKIKLEGKKENKVSSFSWDELKEYKTKEGYKIPLLEDIMQITKGKIFMNLEIKDDNEEIWDYIQELIEKYEYYNQISICGFNHNYYEKVNNYNEHYNRTIVFGFLSFQPFLNYSRSNHQISIDAFWYKNFPKIVEKAHLSNMTVGIWFFSDIIKEPNNYYEIFDLGVDVIITDYPIKVANQLKDYISDKISIEGCKSVEKNSSSKNLSCELCENGYELVYIKERKKNICKLKYEIIPDLYIKDDSGIYQEKNIIEIKMLFSPFENETICQKNGKTIFYFEWLFDLVGYDYGNFESEKYHPFRRKYILNKEKTKNSDTYSLLTEEHKKKLNFNGIEIYVDDYLINSNDFLCIDLYSTTYYSIYTVMGAHCYFIYDGEQKTSYKVKFKLFDKYGLSFVRYDGIYLSKEPSSWRDSDTIYFYNGTKQNSVCDKIKDPFQKRISCVDKINNCKYCEDENTCKECNDEFSLVNGQCLSLANYIDNPKYFTPDNGIHFFPCSSIIDFCEECYYEYFSFNNFHCTKCSDGLNLDESYECDISTYINPLTNSLSGKYIDSSCLNENNILNCNSHKIEIPNFSCWKFKDTFNNKEHCIIFPDNEKISKRIL